MHCNLIPLHMKQCNWPRLIGTWHPFDGIRWSHPVHIQLTWKPKGNSHMVVSHLCLFLESPGRWRISAAVHGTHPIHASLWSTDFIIGAKPRSTKWSAWSFPICRTFFFLCRRSLCLGTPRQYDENSCVKKLRASIPDFLTLFSKKYSINRKILNRVRISRV